MSGLTDGMRAIMSKINANINHTRARKSCAKYFRFDGENVVEADRPTAIVSHSMVPFKSTSMAVDPSEVPEVQERLRKQGLFVEFDREGRPEITSTKQHGELAKALGMKTGRDGYGHLDEFGNFQNSGRRRSEEIQQGRAKVRKAIREFESMPEDVPTSALAKALDDYDIFPTEENTG